MQICMKLDDQARTKLVIEIQSRVSDGGFTYAGIARAAGVNESQVSRICRGQFRTLSFNVVQICNVIGVAIDRGTVTAPATDPHVERLQSSLLSLWDHTPEDADRLVKLLEQLNVIRRHGGSERVQ